MPSAWEKAPWFIGGGVQHSAELARLLAYSAHGGKEGIVRPSHLSVKQLGTPGGGVRVMPGAAVIINRSTGAANQSYIGRLPAEDTVTISATGGSPRTDMIIVRVEDPFQSGNSWPVPTGAAIQTQQYIQTVVVPGVTGSPQTLAAAGLNFSGIPLALVTLPANTSTVLASHITDLRRMFTAQSELAVNDLIVGPGTADDLTSASMVNWPSLLSKSVYIPVWATHMQVKIMIGGVGIGAAGNNNGNGWAASGTLQVRIGSDDAPAVGYSMDSDAGIDRNVILAGASKVAVASALRGTTQTVRLRGLKSVGSSNLFVDSKSLMSMEVTFMEAPES